MKNIFLIISLLFSTIIAKDSVMSIYDFNVTDIDGKKVSMSKYKGKVFLIVNVASKCKFTPQYEGLENLYQEYKDKGFMVLGFPSNDFANQEPEDNGKIKVFCTSNYKVHFDMFGKIDVNGDNTDALYSFIKKEKTGFFGTESIKWNFTKFLVSKNGTVIKRYGSTTLPKEIKSDIELLLSL